MKAKTLLLLERCVEDGIDRGYQRAYKHDDDPTKHQIKDRIFEGVMNEIYGWFDFGEKDA